MMVKEYRTVGEFGEDEIIIQKSRFLCRAKRVYSEEEATEWIEQISKQHWDATHNCYAYRIDEQKQKSSDDGEPAGTAGRPILEVIQNKQLLYTAIVVTRYFGGIKLGAGGLIRAYTQGAVSAIEAAGIVQCRLHQQMFLTFDYSLMGKLEYELRRQPQWILDTPQFFEKITWPVWIPIDQTGTFEEQVINWTHGQVSIEQGTTEYKEIPVPHN
jgi:uncharacterized YigZ family protein